MFDSCPIKFMDINLDAFSISNLADEIRVDSLCQQLLLSVRDHLQAQGHYTPLQIGELCRGADLFLRDFVIAACGDNLFRLPAERVRQFAGHWYIVNSLAPNPDELAVFLSGITACYNVLAENKLVDVELSESIAVNCADLEWYRQRIDSYWAITGNVYDSWRAACPLPKRSQ